MQKAAIHKTVIIIVGPTAVGKTNVAINLAQHYKTEIISADSRQCFKELSIGVARPSAEELGKIKHHFIASHSIQDEISAADFEKYALHKVEELFKVHQKVIMVGGTGLYVKAFCDGLDSIPPADAVIREHIIKSYEVNGLEWLQLEIQRKDPSFFAVGEIQNPQRMMRALEVMESTGQSILSFQKGKKVKRNFNVIKIGLELPKEELLLNINRRVDAMMLAGQLEEVKLLVPYKKLNALQTVGYAELFDYIEGSITVADAVEKIKIHTRQYAKRQMTWFKKDEEINWYHPSQLNEMIEKIELQNE